jgi:two-component system sensor kinase FixL
MTTPAELSSSFMPHGQCFLWDPGVLWLNVTSDVAITAAYYVISAALFVFLWKRKDVPFAWMFALFGLFIFACGTTHAIHVWTVWRPDYWAEGLVKAGTAVLSLSTGLLLFPLLPKAMALRSPTDLEQLNGELRRALEDRQQAIERLQQSEAALRDRTEVLTMQREQLRHLEKEAKLRTVIESVPNGIIMVNERGIITLCNSEAERMFGYERDELLGRRVEILVPLKVREKHPEYRDSFLQNPSKRQMGAGRDLSGIRKDGTEIPVEIGLNHIDSDEGLFVVASIVDITERKKQEEKFRTIVESVPNGIIMVDTTGTITLSNSEAEKLFGYERGELLGKKVESLVPFRYHGYHTQDRERFIAQPQKRQMGAGRDLSGLCKDGTQIPVEIGLNPIETPEGRFVLASIVDITERKAVDDKLHQAYDEVQQKNREMEQFVYTVSHDLKAPLVTSISFIKFLREDVAQGKMDAAADSLQRLEKAHRRMQELINDLLQVSRLGRVELKLESVAIREVVKEIIQNAAELLPGTNVRVDMSPDLPVVMADSNRVAQVFQNLIGNAMKYASDGPDPVVQIFSADVGEEIHLCVKDNGPGIDPQYHAKIFGLFQRLDSSKEGTGVGLTIVSRIMQLHGGRVWVQSELGHGAEFWLAFPKSKGR